MSGAKGGGLVFKITTIQAWREAVAGGAFTGSPDDARDGFVHLSAADQVPATAEKYFRSVSDLVLVAFRAEDLTDAVKWEPSRGGALFPHYYGALPTGAARWVRPLPLDETGLPRVGEALCAKADA